MKHFEILPKAAHCKTDHRSRKAKLLCFALILSLAAALALVQPASCQEGETVQSQGITFRRIPGGYYLLGSPVSEPGRYADEATPRRIRVETFYLAATETTNAQYARFLKATGHQAPLYWHDRNLNAPNQPVVGVTWGDAAAFCRWLTRVTGVPHQLPTEAQWEAAARGGLTGQPFPWGPQEPDAGSVYRANYCPNDFADDGFAFSAPVASFPPNGYGLYDMAGNVSEWVQDRYVPLRTGGPFKPGVLRELKGGSWLSRARDLRCAARQSAPPDYADGYIGFRVARLTAPEP